MCFGDEVRVFIKKGKAIKYADKYFGLVAWDNKITEKHDYLVKIRLGKGSVPGEVLATYLPNQVKAWFDHAIQQQRNDRLHLTIDFG